MINNYLQEEQKEKNERTKLISELYQLRKENEILKNSLNHIKQLVCGEVQHMGHGKTVTHICTYCTIDKLKLIC